MKDAVLINSFSDILLVEYNLSQNTTNSYRNDLIIFSEFLGLKHSNFLNLNDKIINSYLSHLYKKNISSSSVRRKLSSFKSFFNFLIKEGYRKDNPFNNISIPNKNRTLPSVLNEKEILLILNTINKDKSQFGIRLSCIIEILYASGMRVSELTNLPISALYKNNSNKKLANYLVIKGKGKKERIVPLSDSSLEKITNYLELRKYSGFKKSKWFFPGSMRFSKKTENKITENKTTLEDKPITRQRLHQMIKDISKITNISKKKLSPHVIRHSFASHLLNRGMNIKILQDLLGHEDIATTQIYTHLLDSKLKEAVLKNHPLSNET